MRERYPLIRRAAVLAVAVAVLATVLALAGRRLLSPAAPALELPPTRSLEARLTWPPADAYRPHDTPRSERSTPSAPPLRLLAWLEEQGDYRGLVALSLLHGERASAQAWLERAGSSPDTDSDRAVVALDSGDPATALALLERVLRRHPRHAQALWNRALALRELQLRAVAAQAFDAVAALEETGWAAEARRQAEALRAQLRAEEQTWRAAYSAGVALVTQSKPFPPEQALALPGLARLYFYDALRTARSPEQVQQLLPLAEALDTLAGGTVLQQALGRALSQDFRRRAPLVEPYLLAFNGQPLPGGVPAYLQRLRQAGAWDMLMGALLHTRSATAHLEEYRALARQSEDPWFLLLAEAESARAALDKGAPLEAEQLLVPALARCEQPGLTYRCAFIELLLARTYRQLHRPEEAMRHGLRALELLRRERVWGQEINFLMELGQLARLRNQHALARAFLDEALSRQPDHCPSARFVHENNAASLLAELEVAAARAELEEARRCGQPLSLVGTMTLADLHRMAPAPQDAQWLSESLAAVRLASASRPGALALADHIEGRFTLERDSAAGQALLRRAIAAAERLPSWDTDARKARAYSYTSLLMEAGRRQDYARALELLLEEAGGALPSRCMLGVAVDDERALAVARVEGGALLGSYEVRPAGPQARPAAQVLEPELLERLRRCEHVAVVARPPLHGLAELLPPDIAWSYSLPRPEPQASPPLPQRHLVVADVLAPAHLGLARLQPWQRPSADTRLLSGAAATPSHVLGEMERATEVEIHAHGLVHPELSDASLVVLSPEPGGRYALTVDEVRRHRLLGQPLVILAACRAAHTGPSLHEPFSLPVAFLQAGARTVLAATVDVPDAQAGPFFEAIQARIRSGTHPAVALREVRLQWLTRPGSDWVRAVLAFD